MTSPGVFVGSSVSTDDVPSALDFAVQDDKEFVLLELTGLMTLTPSMSAAVVVFVVVLSSLQPVFAKEI